ncbi:MaoC family dehydratase [Sphingomonas sp. AOB5]|uniref:MaoC family dehydratase n=1 Tax=Sphingomonas sp. AOB5 TaxID=3034017 RepID=UPI0023F7CE41|nr:MaoC family dehydratase [Sphingomonas sp. AOB5]MDF7775627.1 MaoC family dehydratase [Sphingomonas sp. AOB5]
MDGNFFEDLTLGRTFDHGTPRTIGEAEASLHIALTGARQPLHSSRYLAQAMGLADRPIDDVLLFNIAFGKTVPDLSLNAVANLGYADVRFLAPVFPGDTIRARSQVIGRRETSGGKAGIVYVRSEAYNQDGTCVLSYVRWVLVNKARADVSDPAKEVPALPASVEADRLHVPTLHGARRSLQDATGSNRFWSDYAVGDRIDHPSGMTIDASDHTLATKLYQNSAKVHFDALAMRATPSGERLVYGGHVISVCRALSYDGLENIVSIAAINGGSHVAPTHAGDTLYCATEVIDRIRLPSTPELAALRLRLWGLKDLPPREVPAGALPGHPAVVLDLDYTVLIPA